MKQEPDEADAELIKRYHDANRSQGALPSAATREAILAEGRRMAAQRAATVVPPPVHAQPAANQPRWRLAAYGTLGAALLASVLMLPQLMQQPPPPIAAQQAAPALKLEQLAPASEASDAARVPESAAAPGPEAMALARAPQTPASRQRPKLALNESSRRAADVLDEVTAGRTAGAPVQVAPAAPAANLAPPPPTAFGAASKSSAALSAEVVGGSPSPALVSAVKSGDLARATQLLSEGADSNATDELGRSPLLLAVIGARADLVRLLLSHGADPNAPDAAGETPLQRARRDHHQAIVELLERAVAH